MGVGPNKLRSNRVIYKRTIDLVVLLILMATTRSSGQMVKIRVQVMWVQRIYLRRIRVPRRGHNKLSFKRVIKNRTINLVLLIGDLLFQLAVILRLSEHIKKIRVVQTRVRRTYSNGRERYGPRLRRLPRVMRLRVMSLVHLSESMVIT